MEKLENVFAERITIDDNYYLPCSARSKRRTNTSYILYYCHAPSKEVVAIFW